MATRAGENILASSQPSFAKRMSSHIAYALVVYTLLLIFEVSPQMDSNGMSILPYFALVALVGLAILPCRNLERRWQRIDSGASDELRSVFKRDVIMLWLCAIGAPTGIMAIIWAIR